MPNRTFETRSAVAGTASRPAATAEAASSSGRRVIPPDSAAEPPPPARPPYAGMLARVAEGNAQQPDRRFGRSGVLGTVRSVRTQSVESRPVMKLELEPLEAGGGELVSVSFPAQG